ncbi:tripartite tricarboxylate transporter permease [Evansella sp. LMS18]|uniref:tripartite tricarboxylate transporter permease n=1 Tax=Evansella sp. LMS18 TaxID=2924033 RepID=UPI0020D150D8|nr:tripartite tricarboxylate transporter permease [Evansella sp. LMS18]UTR12106.1 tripartite tricarboxylate transporter permease [Evansella sp. LMS18]
MENFFWLAMQEVLVFDVLLLIIIGTICGIVSGAIPGFTVTMGIVLAFPFTFGMDPISGLALMVAILVGGYVGGIISGMMLGIPGTPSSIATVFDGYPMSKNGEPGRALGLGIAASFVGTMMSVLVLVTIAPLVAQFSLNFGPWEITVIIIFALTLVGSLSSGAMLKGCIAGGLGLLVATMGIAPSGQVRFDFGQTFLTNGVEMLPVLIGAFAFSQLMTNIEEMKKNEDKQEMLGKMNTKIQIPVKQIFKDLSSQKINLLRSGLIGSVIGAIPAVGGTAANFVSYDQAKKFSKHPQKFGKGIPDGIVSAETSNSGLIGGALIPTLTLGIPGSLTMAIMFGVLIMHGLTPGPRLFVDQPVLVGSIYVSIFIAGIVMILTMFFMIRVFAKISQIPPAVLVPVVLMLAAVGSFALNNNLFDIWTLFIFGIVGYLFTKAGVPLAPLILGVVLGPTLEINLFRALELNPSWMTFLTRPISATLIVITIISVAFAIWQSYKSNKRAKEQETNI